MDHIENGDCPRIDSSSLNEAREKKLEFTRQLGALTNEPVKNDFAKFFSVNKPAESFDTAVDKTARESGPATMHHSNFPALPGRKDEAGSKNAASYGDKHKSDAPAQSLSSLKPHDVARPKNDTLLFQSMDPDNPDNPSFSAERYYSEIIERYTCPKLRCG